MQNDLVKELSTNFIEYAVAVNTDRAIPDAKSGLKPVAKRILWSAYEEGRTSSKPHVKSARIVGDVMGKYHPHGDSSIYLAMVRLSQPWALRYPLIDWHGSNGTIAGDGPAAARYTEARLAKIAEDGLLQGLKKKNVDFIPNYDETLEEPVTLPSIFPNLLCNPNAGIGVAMACSWAPHNLKEVAQAIYDYMEGNEPILPGPDFPTGGIVINQNDIPAIMKTGHGTVRIRGKYKVDKNKIIFYEIPYGETIEGILEKIGEVCDSKEIEGITDAHDESNKKGIRIVITCGKGIDPEKIVAKLFSKTPLQSSFSYNQVALIDKTPTELNLKQCIKIYMDHNIECLIKETNFDLQKAKDRLHIVEGLLIALEDIDNVIALIKSSESSSAAKDALIKKYNLSEAQAKAILAMRLSSLAKLEKIELENEKNSLFDDIADYETLLKSENLQKKEIKRRLEELVSKYGDARRTELAQIEVPKEEKEAVEVVPVDVVVITSQSGLIKKVPISNFKVQRRGGKGVKSNDDAIMSMIKTNTIDYLMFFTDKGRMYRTIVDKVPDGSSVSKGEPISSLINLDPTEKIIAITSLHRKTTPQFVIFITKQGLIKKSYLSEYMEVRKNAGIAAIKLKENDSLAKIIFQDEEDIMIVTKQGMAIKFGTKDINPIGRVATGIKAIKLKENDEVLTALPIHKETDTLGVFLSNGVGKKIELKEVALQNRGGVGILVFNKTSNPDITVAGVEMLSDEDNILLIGNKNSLCMSAKEIPLLSRTALGNILIKDNKVLSITKI